MRLAAEPDYGAPFAKRSRICLMKVRGLRVDPALLDARFGPGCDTRLCVGACCRTGVWLDVVERDRILAHAALVARAMDPGQARDPRRWFGRRVKADGDFPSGQAAHTRVRGGRCVFLNAQGRCVLQKASSTKARGRKLKPFFCTAFPVTIDHGLLTIDDAEYRAGHPCCEATPGGPWTVFDTCAMELRHVLGRAGALRLRRLARARPRASR